MRHILSIISILSIPFFLSYSLSYHITTPQSPQPPQKSRINMTPGISLQKHITHKQMQILRNYLLDSSTTSSMRQKIHFILFSRYKPLVYKTTHNFLQKHSYKSRNINPQELRMYGFIGLFHAIRKYNASYIFQPYVNQYIHGYLHDGMTKLHPISKLSPAQRKRRRRRPFEETMPEPNLYPGQESYNIQSTIQYPYTHPQLQYQQYKDLWQYIRATMPPFTQLVFYYKFDLFFNKIRSNSRVAQLMGCSEERIRACVSKNIIRIVYRNGESKSTQPFITINTE